MKYCIDCKHVIINFIDRLLGDVKYVKCRTFYSPSNGEEYLKKDYKSEYLYASTCRDYDSKCGKEGKYWECRSMECQKIQV